MIPLPTPAPPPIPLPAACHFGEAETATPAAAAGGSALDFPAWAQPVNLQQWGGPDAVVSPAVWRCAMRRRDHHLWKNQGVWYVCFTVYPTPRTKLRLRRTLATGCLECARTRRDEILSCFARRSLCSGAGVTAASPGRTACA